MKILLLGSNGQLGSDIVQHNKTSDLISWTRADLDIANTASIADALLNQSFDVLINCTSYHQTDQVEVNAQQAMTINAFAVKEMAIACQKKSARFIHISTDYVFGGMHSQRPLTEIDAPAPLNVYGASKLMGESLAMMFCANTAIFRVASLFGVNGASGKGGNFIETILRIAREKGSIRVVADQLMSPTSTADIADMLFRFIEKNGMPGIYHAVNTGQASWYEFAAAAVEFAEINATVSPIPAKDYPLPAVRPHYSVLSNAKLARVIGEIRGWKAALSDYMKQKGHCKSADCVLL